MLSQILLTVEFLLIQRYHQKSENEMHKMSYPTKYSYPEYRKNFKKSSEKDKHPVNKWAKLMSRHFKR